MNTFWKILITISIILFVAFSLYYLSTIIIYVMVAGILSVVGRPLMKFFEKLRINNKIKVPRSVGAALTIALFYALLAGIIAIFIPTIIDQVKLIASIDFDTVVEGLRGPMDSMDQFFERFQLNEEDDNLSTMLLSSLSSFFNLDNISGFFSAFVGALGNIFAAIFAITFILFFFLIDRNLFYNFTFMFVPERFEESYITILSKSKELLSRYIYGVVIQMTSIMVLVTLGLWLLGVHNALLIGFFAGVINIIPYIGPIIGLVFGLFVGVTTGLHLEFYGELLPLIFQIFLVFAVVQALDNLVFQPLIFSNSVRAHPLEIFLVILIAGSLSGIAGMVMAIPFFTIIRVVGSEFLSEFKLVKGLTKNM